MPGKRVPLYHDIDGLKYPVCYLAEDVRKAMKYMPKDGDIVMSSYLKCGNNWLEQIIQLILHRGESSKHYAEFRRRTPYPEMVGTEWIEKMNRPRFFKTHFAYERQPQNPNAKYVYLTRNPLDVCVSFYNYTRLIPAYQFEDGSFEEFFDLFVSGDTDCGDFFDHLMSWYTHRHDANVLLVTYEELKREFRGTVLKLAYFLGKDYGEMLESNEHIYSKLVERSSVPFMKNILETSENAMNEWSKTGYHDFRQVVKRFIVDKSGKQRPVNLVRKAVVGDWNSYLTTAHLKRMYDRVHEKGVDGVLKELWGSEDLGGIV